MDFETPLVRSFAARTRKNLEYIEKQQKLDEDVYEVTQLVNSLLGLLVFPQQRFIESIPKTPLVELEAIGWPTIEIIQGKSECQTINDLVRFMRNGVAHFHLRFIPDQDGQLQGLQIWNQRNGQKNWEARLTIAQLRKIADVFIDTIQGVWVNSKDTPPAKMTAQVFGSEDRSCSSNLSEPERLFNSGTYSLEKTLTDTLLRRYPDLEKTIDRVYRRWNLTVREVLRTETGLRLSMGENRQVVQVKIVAGLPPPFQRIFQQAPDPILWELALHQPLLMGTESGLSYISTHLESLINLIGEPINPQAELDVVSDLVKKMVEEARRFNLLRTILSIEEDTLGAYFYKTSTVNIYWLPLGIVASLMNISLEALTVVVLAHELAHAYTHLGLDIDGQSWGMGDFIGSNIRIVEGLAQFYALMVCKKIEADFPAAMDAFNELLQGSPSIYWSYAEWIEDSDAAGEIVRYCLIRTRTQGIRDYPSFLQEVEQGKNLLKIGSRNGLRSW